MSSNTSRPGEAAADVAAQLASAIDEYAVAARREGGAADTDLSGRIAAMWAMLTDADPELAARTARYAGS